MQELKLISFEDQPAGNNSKVQLLIRIIYL